MNIFDIIGPVMVGPSSSHTAGAVKIGYVTRGILGEKPVKAKIVLHGSFAATGKGHGTDRAIVAGLLGMSPEDERIPDSFAIAAAEGFSFSFEEKNLKNAHPNTALITAEGEKGGRIRTQISSIGGGRIMINSIDGIEVNFTGERNTLIINNIDRPGNVSSIATLLSGLGINIATMQLYRHKKGGNAVMILETDQEVPAYVIQTARRFEGIIHVTYLEKSI